MSDSPVSGAPASDEVASRHGQVRPGGRTELTRIAVHEAVIAALQTQGLDFSYSDLALASGVSRRTLHRRWPERSELILDALRSAYGEFSFTPSGDVVADLREFARRFRDFSARPTSILVDGLAALAPDDELARISGRAFAAHTRAPRQLLVDARAACGLSDSGSDIDTWLLMLISPIVLSSTILRAPMKDPELDHLVDLVLRAALGHAPGHALGHAPAPPGDGAAVVSGR